jgi:hypothetical protein
MKISNRLQIDVPTMFGIADMAIIIVTLMVVIDRVIAEPLPSKSAMMIPRGVAGVAVVAAFMEWGYQCALLAYYGRRTTEYLRSAVRHRWVVAVGCVLYVAVGGGNGGTPFARHLPYTVWFVILNAVLFFVHWIGQRRERAARL